MVGYLPEAQDLLTGEVVTIELIRPEWELGNGQEVY